MEARSSASKASYQEKELVFVVGPPRSGTKLLQSILNASREVSIGPESHIFPKLLLRCGNKPLQEKREKVHRVLKSSNYVERLKKKGFEIQLRPLLDEAEDIETLIRGLLQEVAESQGKEEAKKLGDKTPNYVRWTGLLRKHFPEAQFVSIVRDPRDQALSIKKTWKKSPLLAAEKWCQALSALRDDSSNAPSSYYGIHYEELLAAPQEVVKGICEFLDIAYDESMLNVGSTEKFGAGSGVEGVLRQNRRKYLEELSPKAVQRIEEITWHQLKAWGYPIHYAKRPRKLGPLQRNTARIGNFIQNFRFNLQERGWRRGLRYLISIRKDKVK